MKMNPDPSANPNPSANQDLSAVEQYRKAWIVLGTMVAGVAVFAAIATVFREDADPGLPFFLIWAVIGPASVVLAKVIQARMLSVAGFPRGPQRREASTVDVQRAFAAHVIAWALVEGPAMLAIVGYLLGAPATLLAAALATAGVGFAITAPKRESFGST